MLTITLILASALLVLLILYIRLFLEKSKSNRKYVLYDYREHKEYHIFGKRIFSAKCVHPKKDYHTFNVKIFELSNSYFVYIDEWCNVVLIMEINKRADDTSLDAITNGLVTMDGMLTRKGLVESILKSGQISPPRIAREAIVPVMWRKRFIQPAVEIKG